LSMKSLNEVVFWFNGVIIRNHIWGIFPLTRNCVLWVSSTPRKYGHKNFSSKMLRGQSKHLHFFLESSLSKMRYQ
jgi:hypothetical protein